MAHTDNAADTATRRPESVWELFVVFSRLALQGFGGVLAITQRELVERQRWLTRAEFLELLSVGQVLPGPNVVNVSLMIGDRYFGWRGALASMGGMLALPLLVVLLATVLYQQGADDPRFSGALRGMGAVAAGMILATGIKLLGGLRQHPLGRSVALLYTVLTAVLVGALRWPMVAVVLGVGGLAITHVAWHLRRQARADRQE